MITLKKRRLVFRGVYGARDNLAILNTITFLFKSFTTLIYLSTRSSFLLFVTLDAARFVYFFLYLLHLAHRSFVHVRSTSYALSCNAN